MSTETALNTLSRRQAVRRIALILGTTMVGSRFILSGQNVPAKAAAGPFTEADRLLLDEIGDTIIPETDSPGAKATGIGAFMIHMVEDCYSRSEHAAFKAGIGGIDGAFQAQYGKPFLEGSPEERTAFLNLLHAASRGAKESPVHPNPIGMLRELTVLGYFSSEIGCTKAIRFVEVPGAFHGDVPYAKGDKVWYA